MSDLQRTYNKDVDVYCSVEILHVVISVSINVYKYRCLTISPFLFAIVLYVLLQFTDFGRPLGVFKLFIIPMMTITSKNFGNTLKCFIYRTFNLQWWVVKNATLLKKRDDFNFFIGNFPFICSNTFMWSVYISLCWYDIPEFVVPIRISSIEVCCYGNKEIIQPMVPSGYIHHLGSHHNFRHRWPWVCSNCRSHNPILPYRDISR